MKQTLLDIVQAILSAMDSEEINSIDDTVEASQVALICKNVYYDIVTEMDLPGKQTIFQLNASGDSTKPVLMTVPTDVSKVENVRYNYSNDSDTPDYRRIELLTWEEWMRRQTPAIDDDTDDIEVMTVTVNSEDFKFYYRTDRNPSFYTTFNDNTLLFDAYDSDVESTLQKSRTMCNGQLIQTFSLTDSFIPDLDANQFPYYINACKTRAFNELKQVINQESVSAARRQKILQQKRKYKTEDLPEVYNHARYGRGGAGLTRDIPQNLKNGS